MSDLYNNQFTIPVVVFEASHSLPARMEDVSYTIESLDSSFKFRKENLSGNENRRAWPAGTLVLPARVGTPGWAMVNPDNSIMLWLADECPAPEVC